MMNSNKETIESPFAGEKYYRIKHSSGCTVCLYPIEGCIGSSVSLTVKFGGIDSVLSEGKDKTALPCGTAHFLEHTVFGEYKAFFKTAVNVGAYTDFDSTSYSFSCSDKTEESLESLIKCVLEPCITDEAVEKERSIIIGEIRMRENEPSRRAFYGCLNAAYHNHPVRNDVIGTEKSVAEIDRDLLVRCHKAFYRPDNMIISIAGRFGEDRIIGICDRLLKMPRSELQERIIPDEPYEVKDKLVSVKLPCAKPFFEIMYKLKSLKGKEPARASILYETVFEACIGYTSPIYSKLYEQGILDYLYIGVLQGEGHFSVYLSGRAEEPAIVKDKIFAELERLKSEPFSEEDFDAVKKSVYGNLIEGLGSAETMARSVINAEMLGVSAYDALKYAAEIKYEEAVKTLKALDLDNHSVFAAEPV